ncbi:hypothetical protein [Streptomyces sp. A0592]|uniref:hypothetical protein n=1 Tax=Streptomyces sp. A0592 TaxID=2563099 RepID=UPI00109E79A3|nr:hypothetical protein [Streptomyces sp. A0592]THA79759.1 hypothetical protein E6U81_31625 [Streptomyces sp. A0592]
MPQRLMTREVVRAAGYDLLGRGDPHGQPADQDPAGVPDQVHAFLTGRGLLEARLGQYRPHAQHKLVLVIFHARERRGPPYGRGASTSGQRWKRGAAAAQEVTG